MLVEGDSPRVLVGRALGHGGADRVLRLVTLALEIAEINLSETDAIAVSAGPGSLTGLRVGIGTARGLATGAGKRLLGVSTLQAMAACLGAGLPVLALLDAGRGEVYGGLFRPGDPPIPLGEERVGPPEAFAGAMRGRRVRLMGNGARRHGGIFDSSAEPPAMPEPFLALGVARVAQALLLRSTPSGATPRYLRHGSAPVTFGE